MPTLAAELAAIEYAGCAVVSLGFARHQIGHPLDGFGFVVPQTERRRIIAGSFASLKFPGRAPEHHVLIRAFIGGALQPEMLKLPDAELIRVAREELAELLQITGEPVVSDIVRWPRSMPQYHVGHLDRVAASRNSRPPTPTWPWPATPTAASAFPSASPAAKRAAARTSPPICIPEILDWSHLTASLATRSRAQSTRRHKTTSTTAPGSGTAELPKPTPAAAPLVFPNRARHACSRPASPCPALCWRPRSLAETSSRMLAPHHVVRRIDHAVAVIISRHGHRCR